MTVTVAGKCYACGAYLKRRGARSCSVRCRVRLHRNARQVELGLAKPLEPPGVPIAALFVLPDGPYASMRDVELWAWPHRDARAYDGTAPIVGHPPCKAWGSLWWTKPGRRKGDDNGCFAAALDALGRCGGVLEHPANSGAWAHFGLPMPGATPDALGRWTMEVEQGWWGHAAPKRTWLVFCGVAAPPSLPTARIPTGRVQGMSRRQRELTPEPFARWLVAAARSAQAPA